VCQNQYYPAGTTGAFLAVIPIAVILAYVNAAAVFCPLQLLRNLPDIPLLCLK
jgi:hypothetical protein